MGYKLSCADVGANCDFEATGETMEELMKKVTEHAKQVHNMSSIPPELMAKAQAAIKRT